MTANDAFERAVKAIAKHGDTDIFPIPIEKYMFFDQSAQVAQVLKDRFVSYSAMTAATRRTSIQDAVSSASLLATAGYSGFRWASQLEQFWNAYLLGLVILVANDLERHRLPKARADVFSYRYLWDESEATMFDKAIGWREFHLESIKRAEASTCAFVLSCDIADFYPRLYHHSLENELQRATRNEAASSQIMAILGGWSQNVSFGLPVGGDAARLLSELVLNAVDRRLVADGIPFCRFVDDFRIFAKSEEDAYAKWVSVGNKLLLTEGLQLQKSKTLIEPREEFVRRTKLLLGESADDTVHMPVVRFLALKIHFDPYSATAPADYDRIKTELAKHDIVGMLRTELRKSRVDQGLVRRLLRAIKYLEPDSQSLILLSLMESLEALYPLFPIVMQVTKEALSDGSVPDAERIVAAVRSLINGSSYITLVPMNLLHALRVLVHDPTPEADFCIAQSFNKKESPAVGRDCILIAARRRQTAWLKEVKSKYTSLSMWEKQAFVAASYFMGDEGSFWRKRFAASVDDETGCLMHWIEEKLRANPQWELPL